MRRARDGAGGLTKSELHNAFPAMRLLADGLACQRGGRIVFRGLDIMLQGGEALIVTGPNGAGKSSLLRMLAGLVDLAQGSLTFEGGESEKALGEQTHYVGHLDALKAAMSVRQTIQFWSDFLGGVERDIEHVLAAFDLSELVNLPVAYLSAGQRRRLSLSRLLVAPRPLWLLDEPSVALDAVNLARLVSVMEVHLMRGGMIIAATHQTLGLMNSKMLELGSHKVGV